MEGSTKEVKTDFYWLVIHCMETLGVIYRYNTMMCVEYLLSQSDNYVTL